MLATIQATRMTGEASARPTAASATSNPRFASAAPAGMPGRRSAIAVPRERGLEQLERTAGVPGGEQLASAADARGGYVAHVDRGRRIRHAHEGEHRAERLARARDEVFIAQPQHAPGRDRREVARRELDALAPLPRAQLG